MMSDMWFMTLISIGKKITNAEKFGWFLSGLVFLHADDIWTVNCFKNQENRNFGSVKSLVSGSQSCLYFGSSFYLVASSSVAKIESQ